MEEAAGIQGWELLHGAGAGAAPPPVAAVDAYVGIEGESIGAIQLDYFSLDSESRYSRQVLSNGDGEGDSLPDSENPSWVDPESDSRFLGEPSAAGGFPRADVAGFWTSDESSDGQEVISPRGDLEGFDLDVGEGEEIWDFGGVVDGGGESVDLSAGGSPVSGVISESREEINPGAGDLGHFTAGQGGKPGTPWWKLPVELLKFYVLRIRPLWSFSFAAALVGLVILKRRMYKKKPKIRSVPINLTLEDKKNSQFLVRASRLNEAFAVVKRVPMIRSTLPTMGVTPWPVVALR